MDFGDILEQYEASAGALKIREPRTKTKSAPLKNSNAVMEDWLRLRGVFDKDAAERNEKTERVSPRKIPIDDRIDLHGLTRAEALSTLDGFINGSRARGSRKILIITGKGIHSESEPILAPAVVDFLRRSGKVGAFGYSDRKQGGRGAIWAMLR